MDTLFIDKEKREYSAQDIYTCLKEIGVDNCESLFIHSDIMFGNIAKGIRRKEFLQALYEVIEDLGVKNLIVPTFTYSFCNDEVYDVCKSPTSMGAFNEFVRKKEGRYRTMDPLLSLSVPESMKQSFSNVGHHSLGEGSGLDILHHRQGVKFLFFGARLGNCFTYVHYVEKMRDVPYRFDLDFHGEVIDEDGNRMERTQTIHTACGGVKAGDYYYFEDYLEEKGVLKKKRLGDKFVSCIFEKDAFHEISCILEKNIHYFLETPFMKKDLTHEYTMGRNGRRITHC